MVYTHGPEFNLSLSANVLHDAVRSTNTFATSLAVQEVSYRLGYLRG